MLGKWVRKMNKYGLIGYPLSHSFSKEYFTNKFSELNLSNYSYNEFAIENIKAFPELLLREKNLKGLNITIPYKEQIIPFLDELSDEASKIKAVNTIKVDSKGKLIGYNTDVFGFEQAIKPYLKSYHERALILGTGGASKAVQYALNKKGITCLVVSRNPIDNQLSYEQVNEYVLKHHKLIINATPIGMFPLINHAPNIPYQYLTEQHTLFDLVYNPNETEFLKKGKKHGAKTLNGLTMLHQQAEKSWQIWTTE